MPRARITMTPAEAAEFLAGKRVAIVGVLDAHGMPDGEPAELSYAGGVLSFRIPADGAAHRNLLRDPRVVCTAEEFPGYAEIRGVSVHGRAAVVEASSGRVTFRVEEPRIESFDFRRMRPASR
jgi:hypothetical protein